MRVEGGRVLVQLVAAHCLVAEEAEQQFVVGPTQRVLLPAVQADGVAIGPVPSNKRGLNIQSVLVLNYFLFPSAFLYKPRI